MTMMVAPARADTIASVNSTSSSPSSSSPMSSSSSSSSSPSSLSVSVSSSSSSSSGSSRRRRRIGHSHRILIYATCYNLIDGVTLTIRKIERELLAAGHEVMILTTKSGDLRNTDMHGTHPRRTVLFLDNSIPIPFLKDPNNPALSYHLGYSLSSGVRAKLDAFEPSLLHITCPDNVSLHLVQYAREREIPLMGTYHSNIADYMDHYPGMLWLKPLLQTFFKHLYGFYQQLYVPTEYVQRQLRTLQHMHLCTTLHVWGRGINVERFSPRYRSPKFRREQLGIVEHENEHDEHETEADYGQDDDDDDVPVVLWVGRCVPEKRTDIFANVIWRLHAGGVRFKTLVVGAGPSEADVRNLPNVYYCGWLDGTPLSTAYASSDIFLFPSSVETFGNVTLEASASGLPLVVNAHCSGHLVQDGVNGFACTTEDEFFEATYKLIVDRTLRKSCGTASRQFSLQWNERTIVKQMLDHYSNVTDEFYCDYGGRHATRDALYLEQDGAFTAGSHPRPSLFVMVEFVFISAFRIFAVLWNTVSWLVMTVTTTREHQGTTTTTAVAATSAAASMRGVHKSVPLPQMVRTDSITMSCIEEGGGGGDHDDETTVTTTTTMSTTSSSSIVETSSFSSAASTTTTMTTTAEPDVQQHAQQSTTGTAGAVSDADAAQVVVPTRRSISCVAAMADSIFVTRLSAYIIRLIAYICRVESNVRNRVTSFRRNGWTIHGSSRSSSSSGNKRKNSNSILVNLPAGPVSSATSVGDDDDDVHDKPLDGKCRRRPTTTTT